jgi:hypothetical protein
MPAAPPPRQTGAGIPAVQPRQTGAAIPAVQPPRQTGTGLPAAAPPRQTGAAIPAVQPPARTYEVEEEPKSRVPLIIGVAVALAAVGGGAWFLLGRKAPTPPPATLSVAIEMPAPPPAPAPAEPAPPPAAPAEPPPPAPAEPAATPPAAPPRAPAAAPRNTDEEQARLLAAAERKYNGGNFLGAIGDYRRAAAIQPSAPAHVGLARALYDANKATEALSELKVATRVNPKYAPAYLLLGEIHQGDGRVAEARAAYQTFLGLSPTGEQARAVREILAKQLK